MIRRLPLAFALVALTGLAAVADDLPPEIMEAADRAMVECQGAGGAPEVLPAYATRLDLNGDGTTDYLTNLAGLQCTDAWSIFCGSSGCPVSAWLSRADGSFVPFDFGNLQAFEIAETGAAGLPVLRAFYHGSFCGEDRIGADGCSRLWSFATDAPDLPPVERAEPAAGTAVAAAETAEAQQAAPAEPAAEPAADPAPEPVGAPMMFSVPPDLPAGWTLREVPGASPMALGGGVGEISFLAGFCLAGRPFLVTRLDPPRNAATITLGFAFSEGPLEVLALFEPTADGAHVIALDGSPLAARLAGRDSRVDVTIDGAAAGSLSLSGSTRALRSALEDCHGF